MLWVYRLVTREGKMNQEKVVKKAIQEALGFTEGKEIFDTYVDKFTEKAKDGSLTEKDIINLIDDEISDDDVEEIIIDYLGPEDYIDEDKDERLQVVYNITVNVLNNVYDKYDVTIKAEQ